MGNTLPGINHLPSFQSFGGNKENVYLKNAANTLTPTNNYFEYKPVYSGASIPTQYYENHSNYSYQSSPPQIQYISASAQIAPQYVTQQAGNRYTPTTVIYHQPLTSPLDTQSYVKPIRSSSLDSITSNGINLRLPSIQELVSPISSTSSPHAYHPIPQHQQAQQFYEQQQRVLQQPQPSQMQQPTLLHHHHNHHPAATTVAHPAHIRQQIPLQQAPAGIPHHHNHLPQSYSASHTVHHISNIQPKKIRKRTRTGCLTCRKRRIKCDERKPSCLNCEKSKKCCAGYVDVTKKNKKATNSTTTITTSDNSTTNNQQAAAITV